MTEDDAGPKSSETEPPAANQGQDEPIPTTPDESNQSGSSTGESGDGAGSTGSGDAGSGSTEAGGAGALRDGTDPPVTTAGGTPAVAPPGKPDGEVDTRP